ncbi:MAG: adenylyltransferase/cytidyltransferase family protein [Candidatus Levybacteria bacterium]|nr:adenylyltransferase/cytidyltransferase family protein [Candidatus Levybacteria bacterium]
MKKILNIKEAIEIAQEIKKKNKSIVVAGGFFDILHLGHIKFLENAKKQGDYLFVLLEDDKKAKEKKGKERPINPQKIRAKILSALQSVAYVITLKNMTNNGCYDKIITQIAPNIIAATNPDPYIRHKNRQAKLVQGKVAYVIRRIRNYSTTQLSKLI